MDQELYHYGVKGMKWGVRRKRDDSKSHNKNYTDKQRKNDRAFYGSGGEKRINKKLNEGYGLRGARHFEAERKERVEKRKKTAKKIRKTLTKAAVSVGSAYLYDQVFNYGQGTKAVVGLSKTAVNLGKAAVKTVVENAANARVHNGVINLSPLEYKVH